MYIKEFRITANSDGDPTFLHKSNSTFDGWYPRPFEELKDFDELANAFKNPDPAKGAPVHVEVRMVDRYSQVCTTSLVLLSTRLTWYHQLL